MTEEEQRIAPFYDPSQQRDRIVANSAQQREHVIAEVRRWIGTPYHSCADVLGVGVDCGMLIVRCFVDTGLCAPFDPRPYAPDWHLHRSDERYLGFVFDRCAEVETPMPGDVAVFRYGRCYSHDGIVTRTTPLTIVHAFWPARIVMEEEVARNSELAAPSRAKRFFSFWAKPPQSGRQPIGERT